MTGKVLTQLKAYVDKHIQEFSLSGIKNGLHIINVQGNGYQFSEKLLSNGKSNGTAIIARLSNNIQASAEKKSLMDHKGVQATVDMAYHTGERLKYTAVSGNKSTVVVDVPIESKTITFNFIACTDGDGNNYPIVYIGQQIWMAENLKTTKFNDETSIDLGNPGNWTGRLTPAYWWYFLGDEAEIKNTYGLLYNWWAAATGKLCPSGWHVPTTTDYGKLLLNFHELISEAENIGGGKLKEFGLTHWNSPNTGATDETGFTALPGGRIGTGSCEYIGTDGYWWFSDSFEEYFTRCLQINYNTTQIISGINWPKYYGFSIRCIKDE
jgi:uncharacterized protein (TIGR02145 family)